MADWTGPFHMPEFTDDEFKERRARAVEEKGYRVRIPGAEDIINIPAEDPLTRKEAEHYKAGVQGDISSDRWDEIQRMERYRRDKYDAMLRDPSPDIARSRSAIMTAIDDAQDALSTVGVIGRLALPILPRAAAGMVAGPIGWILTGALLLNMMNRLLTGNVTPMRAKRERDKLTKHNPFTQKGKSGLADALKRRGLHSGNLIEGAQVTNDIFGVGIQLGPLMGLPISIGSGLVRMAMGQPVEWDWPPTDWHHWKSAGKRLLHSSLALFGDEPVLNDHEISGLVIAMHCAYQAEQVPTGIHDSLNRISNPSELQLRAPGPVNPITRKVIRDAGDDPDDNIRWPATGERWSDINELMDKTLEKTQKNMMDFYRRHEHDLHGYYTGIYAGEAGLYALENMGGKDTVKTTYTIPSRVTWNLLNRNYKFETEPSESQLSRFGDYLDYHEDRNWNRPLEDWIRFAKSFGINFVQHTG